MHWEQKIRTEKSIIEISPFSHQQEKRPSSCLDADDILCLSDSQLLEEFLKFPENLRDSRMASGTSLS